MTYATLADVEAKWRTLPAAADQNRASALLAEAEALLDSKLPDLTANIAAGTVSAVLARKVVTDAVIRVLGNPSGVTMQTLGPESVQFAGVRTLGTIAFTKDELETLHPADPDAPAEAGGFAVGTATLGIPARVSHGLGIGHHHHTSGWV